MDKIVNEYWDSKTDDFDFEKSLERLKLYVEENNHTLVPPSYIDSDGFELGKNLRAIRTAIENALLPEKDLKKLERIPSWWSEWSPQYEREGFNALYGFEAMEGHTAVPKNYIHRKNRARSFPLGEFVAKLRALEEISSLPQNFKRGSQSLKRYRTWRTDRNFPVETLKYEAAPSVLTSLQYQIYLTTKDYQYRSGNLDVQSDYKAEIGFGWIMLGRSIEYIRELNKQGILNLHLKSAFDEIPDWTWSSRTHLPKEQQFNLGNDPIDLLFEDEDSSYIQEIRREQEEERFSKIKDSFQAILKEIDLIDDGMIESIHNAEKTRESIEESHFNFDKRIIRIKSDFPEGGDDLYKALMKEEERYIEFFLNEEDTRNRFRADIEERVEKIDSYFSRLDSLSGQLSDYDLQKDHYDLHKNVEIKLRRLQDASKRLVANFYQCEAEIESFKESFNRFRVVNNLIEKDSKEFQKTEYVAGFGDWKIVAIITETEFSKIYKCISTDKKEAAVKTPNNPLGEQEIREGFIQEAGNYEKFDSPYLIKILKKSNSSREENQWIALELIDGNTLKNYRESQDFTPEPNQTLKAALHLARAVENIARKKHEHRDINPNNVMYNKKTRKYVLIDFGGMVSEKSPDLENPVRGTQGYIAPEVQKNARVYHEKSDIYSWAATIYFYITGKEPALPKGLYLNTETTPIGVAEFYEGLNENHQDVTSGTNYLHGVISSPLKLEENFNKGEISFSMSDAEIDSKSVSDQQIKVVMESETLDRLVKVGKVSRDLKSLRQDGRDLRKGDSIAIEAEFSFLNNDWYLKLKDFYIHEFELRDKKYEEQHQKLLTLLEDSLNNEPGERPDIRNIVRTLHELERSLPKESRTI